MPYLKGRKTLLRPYRREDQQFIARWANDPDTVRYLSERFWKPYTEKNAEEYVDLMLSGSDVQIGFVIADPETEAYLGQIDLLNINWHSRKAEVGIVLADAASRGRGLGGEALRLLCGYAFNTLGLHRLNLDVYAGNARARACYRKAGFVEEGVHREYALRDGRLADVVAMARIRHKGA